MTATAYYDLAWLEDVYFEDSFVLDVRQFKDSIEFDLDLVLTEEHEKYRSPKAGEQHCYCRARLVFSAVDSAVWENLAFVGSTDAADDVDFGNIDEFSFCSGTYRLSGDWGSLEVSSNPPVVDFDS